jgi:hypothetical protein
LADDKDIVFSKAGYKTVNLTIASGGAAGLRIELVPLSPLPTPAFFFEEIVEESADNGDFVISGDDLDDDVADIENDVI